MVEKEKDVCIRRVAECKVESHAFGKRLKLLWYTNWITVIVPSLLAVTAGSAFFAAEDWAPIVGLSTLFAALLTAIHKGLDCDAYQAEARRLIQAYNGLATRYRTLCETEKENWLQDFLELENRLAELKEGVTAHLPPGYRDKVRKELQVQDNA